MNVARLAGIFLLFPWAAVGWGRNNPAGSMARGVELFRQGQYGAALQQFRSASRMQPKDAQIENLIGITETKLGRIAEANADYERAIRLDPKLEAAHKNLGFNLLNAADYGRAEAELGKALALDSGDAFAHYCLAIVYLKTSRGEAAIAHLEPAQSLIANDADTAFSMAEACVTANAPCGGLKVVDEVEDRSGFSTAQEFQLAQLFNSKRMYAWSVAIFRHLEAAQPESWIAKYNLAVALFIAGRPAEALPDLEQLAKDRPSDERVLTLLGNVYEAAGMIPKALDAYQRALAANPENEDAYLDYTRMLMDQDRYDDAIALIRKAQANSPDDYALDIRLGAIELMKGEIQNAEQAFQKAVAERPDIAVGYVALAKAYMRDGKDQEAHEVLAGARKSLAQDFAIEYVFGLISAELGSAPEAIQAFTNAEQMNPAVVEPHYQLGKLYMSSGTWAQARTELERVIALDPAHAQAHYQLSRVYGRLGDATKARQMQAQAHDLMNTQRDAALDGERERLGGFHLDQERAPSGSVPPSP